MAEFDSMCVNFVVAFPCKECGNHYVFAPFKKKEEFLTALENACSSYGDEKSKRLLKSFPAFAAITDISTAEDKNIFFFSAMDASVKPVKVKWVGESSLHSILSEKDFHKKYAPFAFNKGVFLIRNSDMDAFYKKCLARIENR